MQIFQVPPTQLPDFAFSNRINEGVIVDLEYLYRSQAYVLGNPDDAPGQTLGGFAINCTSEFRCLSFMDQRLRKSMLASAGISTGDLVEITCIWRSLEHKGLFAQNREFFYWQMIKLAVESGRPIILGATIHEGYRRMLAPVLNYDLGHHPIIVNGKETTMWLLYGLAKDAITNLNNAFAPKKA